MDNFAQFAAASVTVGWRNTICVETRLFHAFKHLDEYGECPINMLEILLQNRALVEAGTNIARD